MRTKTSPNPTARIPENNWSASAPPSSRPAHRRGGVGRLILTLASLGLAIAGCNSAAVNQPFETAMINHRSTLMLDATPQPPLTEDQAKAIVAALEKRMLENPYIGHSTSRADFHRRFDSNFKLRDDYAVLSDTLSVLGLSDREQTSRIGKAVDAEFLLGVEAFSVPCDTCLEGDQVGLVGQMLDARTGILVWRVTLIDTVARAPGAVDKRLNELSDELVRTFVSSLRPKWQRERFTNLKYGAATRVRPPIPLPTDNHSPFHRETPKMEGTQIN